MEQKKATQVTGCRTCKQRLSGTQKSLIFLGVFMFFTSIYGTIELIRDFITLFK
jgi:hypothetical protein